MPLILGLDIASSTGECWMDTSLPSSEWKCRAIYVEGEFQEEKATDLALYLRDQFNERRPDFVAIEMPRRDVAAYPKQVFDQKTGKTKTIHTVNADQLLLPALASAAASACAVADIPYGLISSRSWRPVYFGRGFVPPMVWDGRQKKDVADWKTPAVDAAFQQGITLPLEKKAQRDAAEAVGIASAWFKCSQVPARHHKAFLDLQMRSRRIAA